MWVMVDVVANHVGGSISTISSVTPFNLSSHYHDCTGCPTDCSIQDWNNVQEMEHCRLAGLPDLNQTHPFVQDQLLQWISHVRVFAAVCRGASGAHWCAIGAAGQHVRL